jgi:hypothetical protein
LYDDTSLGDLLESCGQEPVFSPEADMLLVELGDLLDEIDLYSDVATLLSHPKWLEVRRLAKKASELVGHAIGQTGDIAEGEGNAS